VEQALGSNCPRPKVFRARFKIGPEEAFPSCFTANFRTACGRDGTMDTIPASHHRNGHRCPPPPVVPPSLGIKA